MCGIAGYYGFDPNRPLLRTMNKAQLHRGPDGEGFYADDVVGLAHLRLAILDRAGGAQPMQNEAKTVTIVYNGEVYNYQQLRHELEQEGATFSTNSDTEVVLRGYELWGEAVLDRLNGMFGLAIRDTKKEHLILARDHFGIKPLYYTNIGTAKKPKILFASEIKALLATGHIEASPNERVLYRYLQFRIHDDSRETFFTNIYRVEAGEKVVVTSKGIVRSHFTTLKESLLASKATAQYTKKEVETYYKKLREAIRLRLQSEVSVGTSLSGGLDSSVVAATVNRLLVEEGQNDFTRSVGVKQNTFSAVFPGSMNDEGHYVDSVLDTLAGHVKSHKVHPTSAAFAEDLVDFVRTQDEPIISSGPYAQYQVMREARKHVTVLLDGQGADEMLAGYVPYQFVYFRQLRSEGRYLQLFSEVVGSMDVLFRFIRFKIAQRFTFKQRVEVRELLAKRFVRAHADERFQTTNDNLRKRLVEDLFHNSLPSLLRYEDRNTMRFSIEGRVPFLDKEVVQYLFSLDDRAIISGGWNKRVLRDAFSDMLPEKIARRRNKIGFTTPEDEWFVALKEQFYQIFMSESFANRPYFDAQAVIRAFGDFVNDRNDATSMLFWRLINVELWLREYIDAQPDASLVKLEEFSANEGRALDITVNDKVYRRYPIRTGLVSAADTVEPTIVGYVQTFLEHFDQRKPQGYQALHTNKWYVFVSEKIIAIMQGRAYFIWDIKVSFWARLLSRFVTRTPHGIGLGSPWTMQLAIQEVGLAKILLASIGGAAGKLLGKRGLFYMLVGSDVRAIDGPTEYSLFPSNVSAKLPPRDPDQVADRLEKAILETIPGHYAAHFGGVIIIDANDIGRNVLGMSAEGKAESYENMFADNPLGQASEQTPIAVVFEYNQK